MKAIVCEMCGSQDLVKKDGVYVCQNCGTKYDPEEAKKLMVEVSGEVKIDNSEMLNNLSILAKRAYDEGNYSDAVNYYQQVLLARPDDWEAYYYCLLSRAFGPENGGIFLLMKNTPTLINLIEKAYPDEKERKKRVLEVCAHLSTIAKNTIKGYINDNYDHFDQYGNKEIPDAPCGWASGLLSGLADICIPYTKDTKYEQPIDYLNYCLYANNGFRQRYHQDLQSNVAMQSIRNKIKELNPDAEIIADVETPKQAGGCYVATAVYGSYDCPQVWTLRRYRDYTLAETWYGRAFVHAYYSVSPTLVKWFGDTEWFKNMWKPTLDRMVKQLNAKGVADTPYLDREW